MKKILALIFLLGVFCSPCFGGNLIGAGSTVAGGGGTVSFVGSAGSSDTDGTVSVTPHSSTSTGDLMIAFVMSDTSASQTITWPSGWSSTLETSIASSSVCYAATKIAGSSETSAYDFTLSQSGAEMVTITTFSKTAGTWKITDHNSSTSGDTAATTLASGNVDCKSGGALYIGWGNDDAGAYETTITGLTYLGNQSLYPLGESVRMIDFYRLYSTASTDISYTGTVSSAGQLSSIAITIEAE